MEKEKYLKDLSEIRSIMDRSARFISLSGLSGVLAGIYALLGAAIAWNIIYSAHTIPYTALRNKWLSPEITYLLLDAAIVLLLAVSTGIWLSYKKAKKHNTKLWDSSAKRLIEHLMIPLATGGILILILLHREIYFVISSLTLIFYGLALVNASKFTVRDVKFLGLSQIAIGLIAAFFPGYGLWFWAAGFGLLHIIYGSIMYFKYDR